MLSELVNERALKDFLVYLLYENGYPSSRENTFSEMGPTLMTFLPQTPEGSPTGLKPGMIVSKPIDNTLPANSAYKARRTGLIWIW